MGQGVTVLVYHGGQLVATNERHLIRAYIYILGRCSTAVCSEGYVPKVRIVSSIDPDSGVPMMKDLEYLNLSCVVGRERSRSGCGKGER